MPGAGPEALPLVNWLFWAALTSGTIGVLALTELLGGTTRGYRLFMAFFVTACGAVLATSELGLSEGALGSPRRLLALACAGGCLGYLAVSLARLPRTGVAALAAVLGVAAILAHVAAPPSPDGGFLVPAFFGLEAVIATVVLGSATSAMLLGHWYLVTPALSPSPLRRMIWLLLSALVLQAVAFAAAVLILPSAPALGGSLGWLTWLRLLAGILLPMVIAVLALAASRAPSLQATTGLLYVALALAMAGTIAGSSITYLTGIPV